ncbi:SDR family oxidoreductase [Microbaculum marinum]|uniref:SDR family oxidoreductase n=1 Tax=Microbaculum marinum TaxID=1764581 RepID=A0AAW9S0L7_9HYPH
MSSRRLEDRIAVVTGASRGIGRAVAIGLAREGAHIIAVARTVGALEELDDEVKAAGSSTTLVPFNLTDYPAIDRLGAAIHERWGKLDILVGNAAVGGVTTPVGHIREKDWNETIGVNLTANWRLIRSLDPLLRLSDAGRAVFMTSGRAHSGRAYCGAYAASKAGLEILVRTYAAELEQTRVKVNLFSPGRVNTTMLRKTYPGQDWTLYPSPEEVAPYVIDTVRADQSRSGQIYSYREGRWLKALEPSASE